MLQFRVRNLKSNSELVVTAAKKVEKGTWHTKATKAKIGDHLVVSNGMGLTFQAERIPQLERPADTLQKRIGSAIQKIREAGGLTQAELAEKIDSSVHYIRAVEHGNKNITINQLQKIIEAAGALTFEIVITKN